MRKLKLFLSMLMLIAFSVGNVWAVDYDLVYTLDGSVTSNASGSSAYATAIDIDVNDITWNVMGNTTLNPWGIGGKNLSSTGRSLFSKGAVAGNILKIEIEHGAASFVTVNSMKVEVATDAAFANIVSTCNPTFAANSTITVNHPDGDEDWSNCYYRITYSLTIGSSNKKVEFKSAKFYKEKEAVTSPTIEADVDEIAFGTKNVYETANQSGSLNIAVEGVNLTGNITATLSGDDAAKFSISGAPFAPTDGSASGTLVVSYEVSEAGDYEALVTLSSEGADDVELPISLSAVNIAPKVYDKVQTDSELSAGDKIVIINEQYKKAAGAISGTLLSVIDITDALDASNGKLSITDEAVQVFTLGGEEGAWTLTSEAGQLSSTEAKKVTANGTTTWAITISSGDAAPVSSTAAAGTLQYNDNSGNGRFTTYTSSQKPVQFYKQSDGKASAGLAYAEADKSNLVKVGASFTAPTLTNPNSLTVAYTSSDDNVVAVDANSGALTIKAAGKAEITASFTGDDDYKAGSATYTIFVAEQAGTAADPLTEASAKALIDLGCTVNVYMVGTVATKNYYTSSKTYTVDLTGGMQYYYFYEAAGETVFETDYLKVGDIITAFGTLKKASEKYRLNPSYMVDRIEYTEPLVDISNTKETAYSVATALTKATDVTSDLDNSRVYISGVVYDIKNFDSENGTLDIYIKDDGVDNKFEFFKCKGINDGSVTTPFASADDVQVGNVVIGYGMLKYYSGGSIWEFDNTKEGDYLVELQKPVTGIELDQTEASVEEEATVTLTATILPSNATGTIVWSVESGSDKASVENGVVTGIAEGEAVIRATVQGTAFYAECTVTVTSAAAPDTRKVANSPAEFTTTNGNLDPADIAYASYQGGSSTAPAIYNDGIRLYQISGTNDFGGFITLTAKAGCTIDEVQITTTSKYATTVAYSVDGNENLLKSESVAASSSYTTGTGLNVSSVNILNVGTGSSGRLEIASIKVYYTGEALTIDHYELGGTYQTAFMQDEEFNHTGLIVYAVYDALGENKVDITSMCTFSEPDMSTTGDKTIEITYNEVVVTSYTINVAADSRKVAESPATFTTVSGDMTPNDITFASYQGEAGTAPANYNNGIRLYQAPSADKIGGYITLKAKKGCTIDQVKITTTNTYATTVAYSVDGNENLLGSESVAKSSDYSTPSGLNVESVNIVNKGTGSSGRLEIASIKVWYTGNPLPVDHYFLDGTYETTFEQNGTFDYTGLEVYASYDAGETITEPVEGFTVEADLSTAGEKKAEVYLNEVKIAEYNITVTAGKEDPALAYSPVSETITAGDAWSAPTLNNAFNVTPIAYSSDKESVAIVDENGVITLAGGYGTAVITAHFDESAAYIESEATYTITVNKPAPTPTSTIYRKVTATADITDGEYLIVYEGDATHDAAVFDGSLDNVDQAMKALPVAIVNDEIAGNTDLDAAVFTIDVTAGTLQSASGWYIGREANSNGMDKSTTEAYVNTFAITDGEAVITGSAGPALRYNYASDQLRFRYYKSGQQAIQLYKKVVVEPEWETVRGGLEPNHYYTVCLPKKMMEVRGASFWTLSSRNEAGSMAYLEEVDPTTAEAGTPFIIQATDTKLEVVYTGTATTTAGTNGALRGTLNGIDAEAFAALPGNPYLLINNAIRPRTTGNFLAANRAYIEYSALEVNTPQPAPGRRVRAIPMQQNTATGIDELNGSEAPAKVLINGQLFILRGEKMYDAKGQLVK